MDSNAEWWQQREYVISGIVTCQQQEMQWCFCEMLGRVCCRSSINCIRKVKPISELVIQDILTTLPLGIEERVVVL